MKDLRLKMDSGVVLALAPVGRLIASDVRGNCIENGLVHDDLAADGDPRGAEP